MKDSLLLTEKSQSLVPESLAKLAEWVNHHNQCALDAGGAMLLHAKLAGDGLHKAKQICGHGNFGGWLVANFKGSRSTAKGYMRISKRWGEISQKDNGVANLSYRGALKLLAPRRCESIDENRGDVINRLEVDEQLLAAIPELSPDKMLTAISFSDDCEQIAYMVEVYPHPEHSGYYFVLFNYDLDTDDPQVIYDRRGVKYDRRLLAYALQHLHGIKPMDWHEQPATGELPWTIQSDRFGSKPGRVHYSAVREVAHV